MELQPAEMSTKKAALGCLPPSLLGDVPRIFPDPPGGLHPLFGTIVGACRKRSRQRGQAAWAGTAGKVWPLQKRQERCPGMPGPGTPPPCRAGACWGPRELAGKPHGKCYNITPGWTKATPHSTSTSPWWGTFNSFARCRARLQKPDVFPGSVCTCGRAQPLQ